MAHGSLRLEDKPSPDEAAAGVSRPGREAPVARVLPAEGEEEALLERLLDDKLPMAPWRFDRDELHDD
jgi:hypothetical protein